MSLIPTRQDFEQQLHQPWQLSWESGEGVAVTLIEVSEGQAMNSRHECYSAIFAQPVGIQMPQHSYRLRSPSNAEWTVMLSPIGPDEDGEHHLLQAVFHCRKAL
ncbi:hypothetical protein SA496_05585 [Pseudomonas sp. JS3066]|uniref:DUF6916 family protein n=1 Tax=unclassified Pseudomonas TaxID=196821 RepID=UPI00129E5A9D|nr:MULTISPECIES: hypothetical protein [unclassified Pseudomonas]MDH4655555.1 hypothetical protein [Pseudomonas sp. BN606]MRK19943.1 hypothetical protein [Pseudomonas sp. JG-B]WVK94660.1 hypothetical protein SA496_05585 [Pseudomonas sp. JS3066]